MPERPNICYIFEKLRVQGCQIWHSHVPIPLNSAPQCKKALTLSFQPKILKISFTKVAGANIKSYAPADFLFPLSSGRWGHRAALSSTWNTLFFTFPTERAQKRVIEWCEDTFMKEWMKALKKMRMLAPVDIQYLFSFGSSIDLTKSRYTSSLRAVRCRCSISWTQS